VRVTARLYRLAPGEKLTEEVLAGMAGQTPRYVGMANPLVDGARLPILSAKVEDGWVVATFDLPDR
jgi:hypothetical protein